MEEQHKGEFEYPQPAPTGEWQAWQQSAQIQEWQHMPMWAGMQQMPQTPQMMTDPNQLGQVSQQGDRPIFYHPFGGGFYPYHHGYHPWFYPGYGPGFYHPHFFPRPRPRPFWWW